MGFELILSYFWFDFVDFVFELSNVEMDCGGRPVIVGWCCVCIWSILLDRCWSVTEEKEYKREEKRAKLEF